jgi:MerR family copper efflux transcriptional regulator
MTPIACTLEGGERLTRMAEIEALGRDALIAASGDGTLRFRNDRAIRARLAAVVAAEARCCPFLELELTEHGEELRLAISAPEDAVPAARELSAAFATVRR